VPAKISVQLVDYQLWPSLAWKLPLKPFEPLPLMPMLQGHVWNLKHLMNSALAEQLKIQHVFAVVLQCSILVSPLEMLSLQQQVEQSRKLVA
jgi:hypothetical protein